MKLDFDILEKIRIYEEKRGITYAKPDGKLYKFSMALYVLVLIYSTVMNLLFALGVSMSETLLSSMQKPLYAVFSFLIMNFLFF